jgi:hypothetical protein
MKKKMTDNSTKEPIRILGIGRQGSKTLCSALQEHCTNYATFHEKPKHPCYNEIAFNSRYWLTYTPSMFERVVILKRNPEDVIVSHAKRWDYRGSLVRSFASLKVVRQMYDADFASRVLYYEWENFVERTRADVVFDIDNAQESGAELWDHFKLEGDRDAFLVALNRRLNAS